MFGNCYLLNYPAITNILAVNQIISQKVQGLQRNEDPTITNKFCYSRVPLYKGIIPPKLILSTTEPKLNVCKVIFTGCSFNKSYALTCLIKQCG